MKTLCSHRPLAALVLIAAAASLLTACGSDETVIKSRVQMEIDACKASSDPTFELKFGPGAPYMLMTEFCQEPLSEVEFTDEINAKVTVGPYHIRLNKNTSDGRWHINQVKWPELDEARSILTWDTLSDADRQKALELFAKAEKQAPKLVEIKLTSMKLLLKLRRAKSKEKDADPAGLGPKAEAYYKATLAAASEQSNPDLAAEIRLMVIEYYDSYRNSAEEFSVPSDSAAEWELGAIKAIENEIKEAEKKGDKALIAKKEAEIETRKQEMVTNAEKRKKEAERMGKLAVKLKERECAEIKAAAGVSPKDSNLSARIAESSSLVNCP